MFTIVSGEIRVVAGLEDGTEVEIVRRIPGEVWVLCINQDQFEGIIQMCPGISLAVIRLLCQRLKESMPNQKNRVPLLELMRYLMVCCRVHNLLVRLL